MLQLLDLPVELLVLLTTHLTTRSLHSFRLTCKLAAATGHKTLSLRIPITLTYFNPEAKRTVGAFLMALTVFLPHDLPKTAAGIKGMVIRVYNPSFLPLKVDEIRFAGLERVVLNALDTTAGAVTRLLKHHRGTLKEVVLDSVTLVREGDGLWVEAPVCTWMSVLKKVQKCPELVKVDMHLMYTKEGHGKVARVKIPRYERGVLEGGEWKVNRAGLRARGGVKVVEEGLEALKDVFLEKMEW